MEWTEAGLGIGSLVRQERMQRGGERREETIVVPRANNRQHEEQGGQLFQASPVVTRGGAGQEA